MNRYFASGALHARRRAVLLTTHAAGFSLLEQTGSGIGDSYAGAAASADDASVMFFNPAGLALLNSAQVTVAAHAIDLETKFHDKGSTLPPAGLAPCPRDLLATGAGDIIPLANAYLAWPINERTVFGFAVNTPFGLKTEYDDPWVGRFQGHQKRAHHRQCEPLARRQSERHRRARLWRGLPACARGTDQRRPARPGDRRSRTTRCER